MFKIILLQHLGCPYTELNTTIGMYTITNADYHVEVIESHLMLLYFSLDRSMLSGYSSNTFFICREILPFIHIFLLLIPQFRYQVVNNICVTHQMQPEFFVVKHLTDIRVIEYL